MKNTFYILIAIVILSSCGPKRMGCGARGICKTPQQPEKVKTESSETICFNY